MNERDRRIVMPGLFALLGLAVLIALGSWQLDRKTWKEGLIDVLTQRLSGAPVDLPPPDGWALLDAANQEFRRVLLRGEFLHERESLVYTNGSPLRPDVKGPGYWVFTPARLAGGQIVMVNRGFVPQGREAASARAEGQTGGPVDIVGAIRWPEMRGAFTPSDDPDRNVWYARDHLSMAASKRLGAVAPFYVDQEEPAPAGGLPRPGRLRVALPNNHLQYALTWFSLAGVLVIVFGIWAVGRRRKDSVAS